jgi:hypothetical protein
MKTEQKFYLFMNKISASVVHFMRVNCSQLETHEEPSSNSCQATVWYSVTNDTGDLDPICKSTFMDIFAFSKKQLEIFISKRKAGETSFTDKCTRYAPGRLTGEERNIVRNHINVFPCEVSHFTRARSQKEYLTPALNIDRLYLQYKK